MSITSPFQLSKNRRGTLPDILLRIREVEPSTVSRQCHLHYHTCITTYQKFSLDFGFTWSRHLSQAPLILQVLQPPQPLQPLQIRYRFNKAHLTHHAYQPTILTKLTIATKRWQFPNESPKTVRFGTCSPWSECCTWSTCVMFETSKISPQYKKGYILIAN